MTAVRIAAAVLGGLILWGACEARHSDEVTCTAYANTVDCVRH